MIELTCYKNNKHFHRGNLLLKIYNNATLNCDSYSGKDGVKHGWIEK